MKTAIIIGSIVLILFVVFQLYISRATKKSENQPYKVIRAEKDFEIRYYPAATMATITSSAKNYQELSNPGFKELATYIFGGNKDNKQIAMTSPVHMDINDSISSMSFVMPTNYNKDNLPTPNNSEVTIKMVPEEYVAVVTFSGFASDESIKKQTALLKKALQDYYISYYGHFRYLGYNPPYQLFGRRNEIIISVNNNFK